MLKVNPNSIFLKNTQRVFTTRTIDFHGTTILNVRKGDKVVMVGDGQISLGATVFKNSARKLRRI